MAVTRRSSKTHDADLCDRIRELEKRVEELEAAPAPIPQPYITWGDSTTNGSSWTPPIGTTITYNATQ